MRLFRRPALPPAAPPALDFAAMERAVRAKFDIGLVHQGALAIRRRRMGSFYVALTGRTLNRAVLDYLAENGLSCHWSAALLENFRLWLSTTSDVLPAGTVVKIEKLAAPAAEED